MPFLLLFIWCGAHIFLRAPVENQIIPLGRFLAYFLMGWIFLESNNSKLNARFALFVLVIAIIEVIPLFLIYPRGKVVGGFLTGNPIYSALLIASAIGLIFSYLSEIKTRSGFIGSYLLVLWLVIGLFLTGSRATYIGFFVALLIFVKSKSARRFLVLLLLPSLLLLFVKPQLLLYIMEIQWPPSLEGLQEYYFGRWVIWKTALISLQNFGLFGTGLGNFEVAYNLFQQPESGILHFSKITNFAHNEYLHLMVVAGIPGLILFLYAVGNILSRLFSSPVKNSWIYRWCVFVIVLFSVTALFNFVLFNPLNGFILSACAGIALGFHPQPKEKIKLKSFQAFLVPTTCFLGVILMLYGLSERAQMRGQFQHALNLLPIRSSVWYQWCLTDLNSNEINLKSTRDRNRILHKLSQALRWDPENPFYWSRKAKILHATSADRWAESAEAYEKARRYSPKNAVLWIDEGYFHLTTNNIKKAHQMFQKAIELEPSAPLPRYMMGHVYRKKNQSLEALNSFQKAFELYTDNIHLKDKSSYSKVLFSIDLPKLKRFIRSKGV